MKRRKLVGITLIATSILLQVGYATSADQITNTVSTKAFKVDFEGNPVITQVEEMDVTAQVGSGVVTITANNLYPGAEFGVTPTVKNNGEYEAKVTHVELVEKTGQASSIQLLDAMTDYAGYQDAEAYNTYLSDTYVGKVIGVGETLAIPIELGLKGEETGFQSTAAQFDVVFQFEQEEVGGSGGEDGGNGGDKEPTEPSKPEQPDESIDIPDEEVPIGPAPDEPVTEPVPQPEVELPDEELPGSEATTPEEDTVIAEEPVPGGMLPKTGGVTPFLVYGLGLTLLGSGIAIYRKKDE